MFCGNSVFPHSKWWRLQYIPVLYTVRQNPKIATALSVFPRLDSFRDVSYKCFVHRHPPKSDPSHVISFYDISGARKSESDVGDILYARPNFFFSERMFRCGKADGGRCRRSERLSLLHFPVKEEEGGEDVASRLFPRL